MSKRRGSGKEHSSSTQKPVNSVQTTVGQLENNAIQRSLQIRQLRLENRALQDKVNELEGKKGHKGRKLLQAQLLATTKEKLTIESNLQREKKTSSRLMERAKRALNDARQLRLSNQSTLKQLGEQKRTNLELTKKIEQLQTKYANALDAVDDAEEINKEMAMKMEVETETFITERDHWKEKHADAVRRLDAQEQQTRDGVEVAQELAGNFQEVNEENQMLKEEMLRTRAELRIALHEKEKTKQSVQEVLDSLTKSQLETEALQKAHIEQGQQLRAARFRAREMEDKVSQMKNKLDHADEQFAASQSNYADIFERHEIKNRKCTVLEETVSDLRRTERHLRALVKAKDQRIDKLVQASNKLKDQLSDKEREKVKLLSKVKDSQKKVYMLKSQNEVVTTKLKHQQQRVSVDAETNVNLQATLLNLENIKQRLHGRLKILAVELKKKSEEIKKLEPEISIRNNLLREYLEHESLMNDLKRQLDVAKEFMPKETMVIFRELRDKRKDLSLKLKKLKVVTETDKKRFGIEDSKISRRSPKSIRKSTKDETRTSPSYSLKSSSRIKAALRSLPADDQKKLLKFLELKEGKLVSWYKSARELLRGLHNLRIRLEKEHRTMKKMIQEKTKNVDLLQAKNTNLISRCASTEEHKQKVVLKLFSALDTISLISEKLASRQTRTWGGAFLTSGGTESNIKAVSEGSPSRISTSRRLQFPEILNGLPFVSVVSLANLGFDDSDVTHLARILTRNRAISELDLHQNKIGDKGLATLVAACASNRVTNLNLNSNFVTAKGIRKLPNCKVRRPEAKKFVEHKIGSIPPLVEVERKGTAVLLMSIESQQKQEQKGSTGQRRARNKGPSKTVSKSLSSTWGGVKSTVAQKRRIRRRKAAMNSLSLVGGRVAGTAVTRGRKMNSTNMHSTGSRLSRTHTRASASRLRGTNRRLAVTRSIANRSSSRRRR